MTMEDAFGLLAYPHRARHFYFLPVQSAEIKKRRRKPLSPKEPAVLLEAKGINHVPAVKKSVADARWIANGLSVSRGSSRMRCKKGRWKALGRMEAERANKGKESKGKRAVKGMLAKREERKKGAMEPAGRRGEKAKDGIAGEASGEKDCRQQRTGAVPRTMAEK